MDDPPASSPPAAEIACEVRAQLAAREIDEHRAKRLRKQWSAHQAADAGDADAELGALFDQLRARVHAQVETRERQFAELEAALPKVRAALASGDVAQAQQLERDAIAALNRIHGLSQQRRQRIITELDALRPKLQELTSWRKWGAAQAREHLIEEIEHIHDSDASLTQIAQRIQRARKQWQQWDRKEKSNDGGEHKLYQRFNRACVKAYQPCQTYFDKQKEQRKQSGATRERICAALEQAFEEIDWREVDWKKTQQMTRARGDEWRKAGPADYKSRKALQQRFDAITSKFEDKFERERARNYKGRELLVAEIEQLAQSDGDARAQAQQLQELKQRWTTTIAASRKHEKAIWNRFTQACDAVYRQRDAARKAFKQELRDALAAREALCAEIETNCDDADDTGELATRISQWRKRWSELGAAPKAAAKKIDARYRDAIARAQKTLDAAERARELECQRTLLAKSNLCAEIEAIALTDNGDATQAGDAQARWSALAALPDEIERVITARYEHAVAALTNDAARERLRASVAANSEALNAHLLRLEILAQIDSPAALQQQRMAMQVARLSAAMGGRPKTSGTNGADILNEANQNADELMRDILLLGAVEPQQRAAAIQRFERCRRALGES